MDLAVDLPAADQPASPLAGAGGAERALAPATTPETTLALTPAPTPAHRGPMRPSALASARRRMSGRTLAMRLRLTDWAAVAAGTLLALVLSAGEGGGDLLALPLRMAAPPVLGAAALLWALKAVDAYAFSPRETVLRHLFKLAGAFGPSAGLVMATGWLWRGGAVGLNWAALTGGGLFLIHAFEWTSVHRWRKAGRLTPNIVVVGATANAARLIEAALKARDAAILGVFDDRMSRIPSQIHGVPVLGDTKALLSHKLLPFIDRIIITVTPTAQNRVRELIDRLKFLPNAVTLFMDVEGLDSQRAALLQLSDAPLTQVSGVREDDDKAAAKRAQDVVLAALGLVIAAPIMLATALAVRLDSPGPVFFRQRRHGFNNEMIEVWKFRSMRHEAADATAARQVSKGDDRVTRVGRVIRRLSLDELPQILNVLKGEMSLVGPRPHAIGMKTGGEESARLVAEYAWRHRMKPGLTGWAQINGSIGAVDTPELVRRRVALDVEYIERQSFWFDAYIILLTIPAMIGARKAVR